MRRKTRGLGALVLTSVVVLLVGCTSSHGDGRDTLLMEIAAGKQDSRALRECRLTFPSSRSGPVLAAAINGDARQAREIVAESGYLLSDVLKALPDGHYLAFCGLTTDREPKTVATWTELESSGYLGAWR